MRRYISLVLFLVLLLLPSEMKGQRIVASASVDSVAILIGDQTGLTLEVVQPHDAVVSFPVFSDTIWGGLEIVDMGKMDTLPSDESNVKVRRRYVVTAFEDSLYLVPALPFVSGSDTIWSDAVALKVIQPFEIDTASHMLADVKDIYKAPVYWWGIIRIVLLVLLVALLVVLGIWLYRRYAKKEQHEVVKEEEKRPPYDVAVEQLDKIKAEKMWQQPARLKEYHTELTDVVRTYIEGVFDVASRELPSSEILYMMQPLLKDKKEMLAALKQMLELSDLVKFAKASPSTEENELSLRNAYSFIEGTRPAEQVEEVKTSENELVKVD